MSSQYRKNELKKPVAPKKKIVDRSDNDVGDIEGEEIVGDENDNEDEADKRWLIK